VTTFAKGDKVTFQVDFVFGPGASSQKGKPYKVLSVRNATEEEITFFERECKKKSHSQFVTIVNEGYEFSGWWFDPELHKEK